MAENVPKLMKDIKLQFQGPPKLPRNSILKPTGSQNHRQWTFSGNMAHMSF